MHLTFFSRKDQRFDHIEIELTDDGWLMFHDCYNGPTNPQGYPHLLRCLEDNYTAYPPAFGDAMEELWQSAHDEDLSRIKIQECLDRFSTWILNYENTGSTRIDWSQAEPAPKQ